MFLFRCIGLIANPEKAEAVALSRKAAAFFREHKIPAVYPQQEEKSEQPDLVLTFGGDGTLLIGAHYALKFDAPLMGFNLGTVGFLTEEEPEHLQKVLEGILNGEYHIENRSLLHVINVRSGKEYLAVNDAVITRGGFARLIRVDCQVNGEQYGLFTADGIIAATPTGSTGYSLSAGGPIVEPDLDCITLTPVCAHSLQHCPCIVSGKADIRFKLLEDRQQTAELQIDGMNKATLKTGDEIRITGSNQKIRLLRTHPYHFFTVLHSKLIEWSSRSE